MQGWCIGGGTDMALRADLIVAAHRLLTANPQSHPPGCGRSWIGDVDGFQRRACLAPEGRRSR